MSVCPGSPPDFTVLPGHAGALRGPRVGHASPASGASDRGFERSLMLRPWLSTIGPPRADGHPDRPLGCCSCYRTCPASVPEAVANHPEPRSVPVPCAWRIQRNSRTLLSVVSPVIPLLVFRRTYCARRRTGSVDLCRASQHCVTASTQSHWLGLRRPSPLALFRTCGTQAYRGDLAVGEKGLEQDGPA